jgi:hypothetical protein
MAMIGWNLYISEEEFDFYEHGLSMFEHSPITTQASSPNSNSPILSPILQG